MKLIQSPKKRKSSYLGLRLFDNIISDTVGVYSDKPKDFLIINDDRRIFKIPFFGFHIFQSIRKAYDLFIDRTISQKLNLPYKEMVRN